ncbi:hypothetical protein [Actinorhabdospora filicis]|nr:hypothetical protein [Actinorhabdospora filicis]
MRLGSTHIGKRPIRRPVLSIQQLLAGAERLAEEWGYGLWAQAVTGAYTGMRWGEICGLDRRHCHLGGDEPYLEVDPDHGALHEVGGKLWLGPPKSEAAARRIDLPGFLAGILQQVIAAHSCDQLFISPEGEWWRRSNFSRRIWRPVFDGDTDRDRGPIAQAATFHGSRHLHKTILDELDLPEVLEHDRMGYRMRGVSGVYSHVTPLMREQARTRPEAHWQTATAPHRKVA